MDIQAPDTPAEISDVPALGALAEVGRAAVGLRRGIGIKGDGVERHGFARCRVREVHPAIDAMIVVAEVVAARRVDAVDHAGFKVRHEQPVVNGVIGNVAERGAGIRTPVQGHVGEFFGFVAIVDADAPDTAWPGVRTPHAGHPVSAVRADGRAMKAESRCCRQKDIGTIIIGATQSDTEDLPNFARRQQHALGLVDPVLARGRFTRAADIDDAGADAVDVDHIDRAALVVLLLDRMRKPRHHRFAGVQRLDFARVSSVTPVVDTGIGLAVRRRRWRRIFRMGRLNAPRHCHTKRSACKNCQDSGRCKGQPQACTTQKTNRHCGGQGQSHVQHSKLTELEPQGPSPEISIPSIRTLTKINVERKLSFTANAG